MTDSYLIHVCGDLMTDFSLLRHTKEPAPFHSGGLERVELRATAGGAWYLADVLSKAFDPAQFQVKSPDRPAFPDEILPAQVLGHAYQTWECVTQTNDDDPKDEKKKVWRVRELLGCTASDKPYSKGTLPAETPTLLAIEDLGLGFANEDAVWPTSLNAVTPPCHVVLKVSGNLYESKLWKKLLATDRPDWKKHLTVVLSAQSLRQRGASLRQGLSWDRTLDDLDQELIEGRSASDLGKCARVFVTFGDEAVAVFIQKSDGSGLTFDRMIFDPNSQEGAWKESREGRAFGGLSLITAAVIRHLCRPEDYPLNLALARGLKASRDTHHLGGGPKPMFDIAAVLASVCQRLSAPTAPVPGTKSPPEPMNDFVAVRLAANPDQPFGFVSRGTWPKYDRARIDLLRDAAGNTREAMLATALDIVVRGPEQALRFAPKARYGKYVTADREEIERINAIRNLVLNYLRQTSEPRPLSIAVFGAPGCGKSFAVKELISTIFPHRKEEKPLTFNLSEFRSEDDLAEAFHEIRDLSQRGQLPLVFWDEFDSKRDQELAWLKSFLAPMQDSEFRANNRVHPLGRALFIFAGGTCRTYTDFSQKASDPAYKDCKITDFLSRLRGFIDIKGPNPASMKAPDDDPAHVIRRALMLHITLKQRCPHVFKPGALSADIVSALLQAHEFRHGSRSIDSLVAMCQTSHGAAFTAAALPAPELMGLHIADPDFTAKLAQAPLDAELIDQIANVRHEAWMKEKEKQGYRYAPPPRSDIKPNLTHPLMLPYSELSELEKEGDRRPARLTADYLKRLGYNIRRRPASGPSPAAISTFPTDDLNKLIHHEHNIWMQEKWLTGWDSADIASNHLRLHHDLVDTAALSSTERALDQAIINALPNGLQAVGWEIIK